MPEIQAKEATEQTPTTFHSSGDAHEIITGRCPVCKEPLGKRYIPFSSLTYDIACKCMRDKAEQERARELEEKCIATCRKLLNTYLRTLPEIYKAVTLYNYKERDEDTRNALGVARRYVVKWPELRKEGKGLLFCGTSGNGKTHLSCAIGREVAAMGYTVRYIRTARLLRIIKDAQLGNLEDTIAPFERCSLLILDDLGKEKGSDWVNEQLNELIDCRTANKRPMIVTCNMTPEQFASDYDSAIVDRLNSSCYRVKLETESYRRL